MSQAIDDIIRQNGVVECTQSAHFDQNIKKRLLYYVSKPPVLRKNVITYKKHPDEKIESCPSIVVFSNCVILRDLFDHLHPHVNFTILPFYGNGNGNGDKNHDMTSRNIKIFYRDLVNSKLANSCREDALNIIYNILDRSAMCKITELFNDRFVLTLI